MGRVLTYLRTLRYLRPSQVVFQVLRRIQAKLPMHQPDGPGDRVCPALLWAASLELMPPSGANACLDLKKGHFRFIGIDQELGYPLVWKNTGAGKLWDYNLHYFEWTWGLEPGEAKEVTCAWVQTCKLGGDHVGWEPYPLSLRLINWLGYWGSKGSDFLAKDGPLRDLLWDSVYRQANWLCLRLEKHLLGNHYLENGMALWVAGSFFEHTQAMAWKRRGRAILDEQLNEQILPDGVHFERSPMYHNRVLYLLRWLVAIDPGNEQYRAYYERVLQAAALMTHPDGGIALFNDSALGIYPECGHRAPEGVFALPGAGYFGARNKRGDFILCDAGRIGPDYLPGHAHCDVFSFELSVAGKRIITDTGVSNYNNDSERHYTRSTRAHNTFGPANREQAEIWAAFRVGNRPEVTVKNWHQQENGGFVLEAEHDGYTRGFRDRAMQRRRFVYQDGGSLRVEDHYDASHAMLWEGRLHLHPDVEARALGERHWLLTFMALQIHLRFEGVDNVLCEESVYYPCFNQGQSRSLLLYRVHAQSGTAQLLIDWSTDHGS